MKWMAAFRNLILARSCSLRRPLLRIFRPHLQEESKLFSSHEFLGLLNNAKTDIDVINIRRKLMRAKGKTSNQINPHVSTESGVELRPQLHVRKRALPLPSVRFLETLPSPSPLPPPPPPWNVGTFPTNIQASTDYRSYKYAGLACNAAPLLTL